MHSCSNTTSYDSFKGFHTNHSTNTTKQLVIKKLTIITRLQGDLNKIILFSINQYKASNKAQ